MRRQHLSVSDQSFKSLSVALREEEEEEEEVRNASNRNLAVHLRRDQQLFCWEVVDVGDSLSVTLEYHEWLTELANVHQGDGVVCEQRTRWEGESWLLTTLLTLTFPTITPYTHTQPSPALPYASWYMLEG